MKTIYPKNLEELIKHVKSKAPSLYLSSRTSTVIPFAFLDKYLDKEEFIVDLSLMPKSVSLEGNQFYIKGALTWEELNQFAASKGKRVMTTPTDQSACVLAGLATSCTGELAFSFGTLRDQVTELSFINSKGEPQTFTKKRVKVPEGYRDFQEKYQEFKNAPFPLIENEVDYLIGSEGQLGVITECKLKCVDYEEDIFLIIPVSKWEEDFSTHLEILSKVQGYRSEVLSCEFLDSNALKYGESSLSCEGDVIVLQVLQSKFEKIYDELLASLNIELDSIVEMKASDFHKMRVAIPRNINEMNSRTGVVKKGTDVQVGLENFESLLHIYRKFSKLGVKYNLFGHFGDCHLHFNFLPAPSELKDVEESLQVLYKEVKILGGSPFAEHGIGVIKRGYIQDYWGEEVINYLGSLKECFDPDRIFFPSGYMG